MNNLSKILLYVSFAIGSFLFFLYITFPYQVLKEMISSKIEENSGVIFHIDELSPKLPVGLELKGLSIQTPGSKSLNLNEVEFDVSLLSLLLGKAKINLNIKDKYDGQMVVSLSFGIFKLLSLNEESPVPSGFYISSDNFDIASILNFILSKLSNDETTNPMIKSQLGQIYLYGKMNSKIDLDINSSELSRSQGVASININDAMLEFDETLDLPSQEFNQAKISASFKSGRLEIDEGSGISSDDLDLLLEGNLTQKPDVMKSVADFVVHVEIRNELNSLFGFVLDYLAKKSTEGKVRMKIKGPLTPLPEIIYL
ncbi:MAG: type II secretion system protein GspN [Zetaproteobacteria bacterium]|nr:type II secretion system protein GspN [Pseudobdellovibrionaceae bacterium]|tara:strand:+ start:2347 stop:3285 length:939 start_codon:yes stop_codon:yes gene_type:complete